MQDLLLNIYTVCSGRLWRGCSRQGEVQDLGQWEGCCCCWVSLDGPCGALSQLCQCLGNKLQGVSLLQDSYRLGKESHSSASCSDKASVAVAWLPGAPACGGKAGTSVEEVLPAGRAGAAALNKQRRQSLALALPSTVAVQGGSGVREAGCGAGDTAEGQRHPVPPSCWGDARSLGSSSPAVSPPWAAPPRAALGH